jgi:hypothetical protein
MHNYLLFRMYNYTHFVFHTFNFFCLKDLKTRGIKMFLLLQGPPVDVGGYYKPDPVKESIRLLHCTWIGITTETDNLRISPLAFICGFLGVG